MNKRRSLRRLAVFAVVLGLGVCVLPAHGAEGKLAHMVFFTLKDKSNGAKEKLVSSCRKYLADHEGVLHFSVGTIAEDVKEPVSDRDFDVALHLIFRDKEAGANYLKSDRHQQFVEANKETFAKVRVFDSYLAAP